MIDYYIHFPPTPLKTNFIKPPTMSKKNNKRQRGLRISVGFGSGSVQIRISKSQAGVRVPSIRVYLGSKKSGSPPPWFWGLRVPITIPNAALGVKASINANHTLKNADRNYVQVYTLRLLNTTFGFILCYSNQNSFGKSINTTGHTDVTQSYQ